MYRVEMPQNLHAHYVKYKQSSNCIKITNAVALKCLYSDYEKYVS